MNGLFIPHPSSFRKKGVALTIAGPHFRMMGERLQAFSPAAGSAGSLRAFTSAGAVTYPIPIFWRPVRRFGRRFGIVRVAQAAQQNKRPAGRNSSRPN
jgi:hypothetical protein